MPHIRVDHTDTKTILNRTSGFLTATDDPGNGFHYTLNPYRGCTFNCSYCYAPTFVWDTRDREAWGQWVTVKDNAIELLEMAGRYDMIRGHNIYMSSVTDPYQPIEKKLELTRSLLQVFQQYPPRLLVVQTRSPLVTRDIDLLAPLGRRVVVCVTVSTDNDEVRQVFERQCAPISARVEALRQLKAAGIATQATVAPTLPCDADRLADLLDPVCDWIVASTFRSDGGYGSKTRAWGVHLYEAHGYGHYLVNGDLEGAVVATRLQQRLGQDRVRTCREGFAQVCREMGVMDPKPVRVRGGRQLALAV